MEPVLSLSAPLIAVGSHYVYFFHVDNHSIYLLLSDVPNTVNGK